MMPDASDMPHTAEVDGLEERNYHTVGIALDEAAMVASVAAEQHLLGALLIDGDAWNGVSRVLSASDFSTPQHQYIYRAVSELAPSKRPIDVVTVSEQLTEMKRLEIAGGMAYLIRLANETATSANAVEYARIVREKALRRGLAQFGRAVAEEVSSGFNSQEILESLQPKLEALQADITDEQGLRVKPLNWRALKGKPRPVRRWAIDQWLGMGYVTLLAGAGGLGKTLVAQTIATCLAVGKGFIGETPKPLRVLMIAGEDEEEELHARQIDICEWLGIDFDALAENLILVSYKRRDITVAELRGGALVQGPFWRELKAQIAEYKADYVILDSSARTFGGNENDRHQVTKFVTWLEAACESTGAGLLLLAHPAKAKDSEFSGSTAWEASVRSRLYLGRAMPDQEPDELPPDDGVRYLCRRKANYSDRDWRKLIYTKGVLVPEQPAPKPFSKRYGGVQREEEAQTAVLEGVKRLADAGMHARSEPRSPEYLPKKLAALELTRGCSAKELTKALNKLLLSGRIKEIEVGKAANRSRVKMGLVLGEVPL